MQASRASKPAAKSFTKAAPAAEPRAASARARPSAADSKKCKELEEKNIALKLSVDSLEQERDFYFAKLRDIEILCTDKSLGNNQVVKAVQTILFATDEYDIQGLIKQAGEGIAVAAAENLTSSGEKAATEGALGVEEKTAADACGSQQEDEQGLDHRLAAEPEEESGAGTGLAAASPTLALVRKESFQNAQEEAGAGQKENLNPEDAALNKSPLLPVESSLGVNFLEDSGMDLLKTSPFSFHNA